MTKLSYHLIAGGSPISRHSLPIHLQVFEAVGQGLWIDLISLECGVEWERAS